MDVGDTTSDEVAAPEFAVDRGIEHREVANAAPCCNLVRIAQICLGLRGGFGPMMWPWFQDSRLAS